MGRLWLRNWTVWVGDGATGTPTKTLVGGRGLHPFPSNTHGQYWSLMGLLAHMVQKLAGRYWTGMGPAAFWTSNGWTKV
jgi:hypothetical protein